MKRMLILFSSVAFTFLLSCEKDSEPNCPPPTGEMIAQINDTIVWDFKYVSFRRWSDTEFANQWADSSISISSEFINSGCERELSLDFHNISQILTRQTLVKRISEENHPSHLQPHSIFYTWNVDALTEKFDLYESEPAWIQLSEITEDKVKGIFQGTYVYRQSTFRFWNLPDTLRFNNVSFEAILFVPPND
ncbi:hypothetical protein [Polaribacter sp. HL-MS24]|uniref:hypothetical protein n=1 Tax=Polaribacter sp. HL-MS24 TaxID=3077735 RepID=UPI00293462D8|nr:hypothetical protein [Polaribacter sp. HL-MS24]WOC39284.1 hypothetical protein RRF69_06200 [Polaribacter sp. HL-MS24]